MKERGFYLVILALVIVLVISYAKISSLEKEIDLVRNESVSEVNFMRNQIQQIYSNVDQMLKQQASLMADVSYEKGDFDPETLTVPLTLSLTPKTITEDLQMSVMLDGITVDFTRTGNRFEAIIPVDIFLDYDQRPTVYLTSGNQIQTEVLDDVHVSGYWAQHLPQLIADQTTGRFSHSNGKLTIDSEIMIQAIDDKGDKAAFESVELITKINDEKISRIDITTQMSQESEITFIPIQASYELNEDDVLSIFVSAVDSYGFTHTVLALNWFHSDGPVAETVYGGECIYDADGNMLYGKGYE